MRWKASITGLALLFVTGAATRAAEAPSRDWLERAEQRIREAEYFVTWQDRPVLEDLAEAWHAPNREHGLRTYFAPAGIRVLERTVTSPTWEWSLTLTRYGRGADGTSVEPAHLDPRENRIDYDRGDLVEWYVNDERGLEQGFDLAAPPPGAGDGDVFLEMRLGGTLVARPTADGSAVDFLLPGGAVRLRYHKLWITDATGAELPGRLETWVERDGRGGIRIRFDDRDAVWPVHVDPLVSAPLWSVEADQESANMGASVSTAGDVNDDGYSDVLVGAPFYDNGQPNEGLVFGYYGTAGGLPTVPDWSAENDWPDARFGFSVSPAGDVNGDGYADIICGSPRHFGSEFLEGRVFAYYGSATGLPATFDWSVDIDVVEAQFGYSVAAAGDVNRDNFADVIVGAPFYTNDLAEEGAAFLFLGSASGIELTPTWTAEGDEAGSGAGWSVATAGDVNGDTFADLVVGAPFHDGVGTDRGRARVFYGSLSGPSATADVVFDGDVDNGWYGAAVSTAGDVNADGFSDVAVGARLYSNGQASEGAVFVYHGDPGGLVTSPAWTREGDQAGANYGYSVATAGDVNGDGYGDLVIGSPFMDNGEVDEGVAYLFQGSATGLGASPVWSAEPDTTFTQFGRSVATAGDIDGDGYSDVIVGVPNFSNGEAQEGAALLYRGTAAGPDTVPGWSVGSGSASARFGFSVAAAGDIEGDRFSEVVIGAPYFDQGAVDEGAAFLFSGSGNGLETDFVWQRQGEQNNAHFGWSVAAADTNGDGRTDVIVGAPNLSNGQSQEGLAFMYLGTASGAPTTQPIWVGESDQADADYGWSVASAGDLDGDGRADIIIGAPLYDNGDVDEGAAFVYFGTPAGPAPAARWMGEADQAGAGYGYSVASAGDPFGTGYASVLVGAPFYDASGSDNGRVYAYRGHLFGLLENPFWTQTSTQNGARFGFSVAPAGDVQGDGLSDVVIGAPQYSGGQLNEGAAFLYAGTGTGIANTPQWSAESDQANAALGHSVAGAGDVNGDGFSDVIIGTPFWTNGTSQEGKAEVYAGSPVGLSPVPFWSVEGGEDTGHFGYSVAGGADVNADGYADVIVGAPRQDNPSEDEGVAHLFYGNGRGASFTPQQRQPVNDVPISPGGFSEMAEEFRISARGRTPFGRGQVRLQWEVRELGEPFTGVPTGEGPDFVFTVPAAASLDDPVEGLVPAQKLHWRTRVIYRETGVPFQPQGRWFSPPSNGWGEMDLRLAGSVDVSMFQSDSKDPVFVGESYSYTINVTSNGPDTSDVTVQDDLPGAALFLSAVPTQGECFHESGVVTCILGEFEPTDTASITITVIPLAAGVLPNPTEAASPVSDPSPLNDASTINTTVKDPTIGNRVWEDLDGNGVQDLGEPGVENVLVAVYTSTGVLVDTTVTNSAGEYAISPLNYGNSYFVRFFPPPGFVVTLQDQGGNDAQDSDADPFTLQTAPFPLLQQSDILNWDVGLIPDCVPPDEAVFISDMAVTDDGNAFPILTFLDPNQPSQITGYNVYRSETPQGPAGAWPLVASDVIDQDEATANKQWIDSTGDISSTGIYYYRITAYNHRCPAEGPFQGE